MICALTPVRPTLHVPSQQKARTLLLAPERHAPGSPALEKALEVGWWAGRYLVWHPGVDRLDQGNVPGSRAALTIVAVTVTEARRAKLSVNPVPREMAFPVPKGECWHDHYSHVR